MNPLRMTTRPTSQWLADRVLEYVQDYDTAYQSFMYGQQLTAEEQSRWSVQMILHQFRTTEGVYTDEVRFSLSGEPLAYSKETEIGYVFSETLREDGYDDYVIGGMMVPLNQFTPTVQQFLRSPGANFTLAPFRILVNNRTSSQNLRSSLYTGTLIALLDLPNYRQAILRTRETLRAISDHDQRFMEIQPKDILRSIETLQSYANILLVAMVQHTNTRVTYQHDVPYEWQYPMFLETLNTVVDEHHDTIQQVLYTAGMSVRRGSRKVNHHILSDVLLTVARLERDVKRSKNT